MPTSVMVFDLSRPLRTALMLGVFATGPLANAEIFVIKNEPVSWQESLPVANDRIAALVLDTPLKTSIRGFFAKPLPKPTTLAELAEAVSRPVAAPVLDLEIEWLNQTPVTGFRRTFETDTGLARTIYRQGKTTITRTVLASAADDAIFLHFIADQPGALSFKTGLVAPDPENALIKDRVQISWQGKGENADFKAAVWVLPFESDVESEGKSIVLRGEGECIVIVNFTNSENPDRPVSATLARLGATYDPGHQPPDPVRIWHAVLAKHSPPAK